MPNFNSRAWMNIFMSLIYVDVIARPCPNPDADLANLCQWKEDNI